MNPSRPETKNSTLKLRADLPAELPVHAQPIEIVDADGWRTTVATVWPGFLEPAEVNRRALLLASAPDLLVALQEMMGVHGHMVTCFPDIRPCGELCQIVRAAVSRATTGAGHVE